MKAKIHADYDQIIVNLETQLKDTKQYYEK